MLRGFRMAGDAQPAIPHQTKKDVLESIKVRRRSQITALRRKSAFGTLGGCASSSDAEGAPGSAPGKLRRDSGEKVARGLKEELANPDRWSEPSNSPERVPKNGGGDAAGDAEGHPDVGGRV
tara:strand:- start:140 stop:505 length:366 start_codon:yes stop_codon:yes gene_type:complete